MEASLQNLHLHAFPHGRPLKMQGHLVVLHGLFFAPASVRNFSPQPQKSGFESVLSLVPYLLVQLRHRHTGAWPQETFIVKQGHTLVPHTAPLVLPHTHFFFFSLALKMFMFGVDRVAS